MCICQLATSHLFGAAKDSRSEASADTFVQRRNENSDGRITRKAVYTVQQSPAEKYTARRRELWSGQAVGNGLFCPYWV
jgi:hypothetical protein